MPVRALRRRNVAAADAPYKATTLPRERFVQLCEALCTIDRARRIADAKRRVKAAVPYDTDTLSGRAADAAGCCRSLGRFRARTLTSGGVAGCCAALLARCTGAPAGAVLNAKRSKASSRVGPRRSTLSIKPKCMFD